MGGEDSTNYEKVYGCCRARGMNDGYLTLGEDTHRVHGWEHKKM